MDGVEPFVIDKDDNLVRLSQNKQNRVILSQYHERKKLVGKLALVLWTHQKIKKLAGLLPW